MLAMPKGIPSPAAGLCQQRLERAIRRISFLSVPCGSQAAPAAGHGLDPEAATQPGGTAARCTCTSPLLSEPAPPAVFLRLEA